jgi:hypothetical protein
MTDPFKHIFQSQIILLIVNDCKTAHFKPTSLLVKILALPPGQIPSGAAFWPGFLLLTWSMRPAAGI